MEHTSAEAAERRRQNTEDVQRRREYRKAHGIENKAETMFGDWAPTGEVTTANSALREGGSLDPAIVSPTAKDVAHDKDEEFYVDFEGNRQAIRKKWFGIW